ncbi:hypothetical protein Y032_0331g2737 [Ancylostoma ceylanicum]|uniref:Uncharacterized protein n=1 Tax=Ancylostoma ceylanicum TaxID=53326 RepID=A0A016S037_9BILA|nr:hypothetical protein Y032_0331g2737 [Ancylostoma ceylanicum]
MLIEWYQPYNTGRHKLLYIITNLPWILGIWLRIFSGNFKLRFLVPPNAVIQPAIPEQNSHKNRTLEADYEMCKTH